MLTLSILIATLIALVIAKVTFNKLTQTVSEKEEVKQVTVQPVSNGGVIYIFPKRTLDSYQNCARQSRSTRTEMNYGTENNELSQNDESSRRYTNQRKNNRVQQALQANPQRERTPVHQITVKEWMQNDSQYQALRGRLRTG